MKAYFFNRRQIIVFLRWLLFIILGYILLLGEGQAMSLTFYLVFLGLYALSNLTLMFISDSVFKRYHLEYVFVLFDIVFISVSIFISGDLDLYIIYFLTVLLAAFGGDLKMSVAIAVVAAFFYSFISYRFLGVGFFLNTTFLVRVPFFYVVALITSFLSQEARIDKTRLERTEKLLEIIGKIGSSLSVRDLLIRTGEAVFNPHSCSRLNLIALDPKTGMFYMSSISGEKNEQKEFSPDEASSFLPPGSMDQNNPVEMKGKQALSSSGLLTDFDTASVLSVPAVSSGVVGAWLIAHSGKISGLSEDEKDLLKLVAGHLPSELARVRERANTIKRAKELEAMIDVSRTINQSLNLEDVLNRIVNVTAQMLGVEAASILLVDEAKKELVFQATSGEKADKVREIRLKMGQGIAGWVAQEARSIIVPDVGSDPRFFESADKTTGFKTRALAAVPLRGKSRVIGVLEAINKKTSSPFDDQDVQILNGIASQASVAIERAKLYEYMEEQTNETIEMYLNLEKEKSRVETILASMGEAVMVCDEAGEITLINRKGRALVDEICETSDGERSTVREMVSGMLSGIIAGSEEKMVNIKVPSVDEIFQLRTTPILTAAGKPLGGVAAMEDITELHRLNEMKTEFLSHVSHELRTPLTAISGAVSILLRGKGGQISEQQATLLQMIREESGHLVNLVNDLLDLSRLELGVVPLSFEQSDLEKTIRQSIVVVRLLAEQKGVILTEGEVDLPLPSVSMDVESIKRVIINLLSNAVKFTPASGSVAIGASVGGKSLSEKGPIASEVTVWVRDTGMGIPQEDIEGIFEKFYRTRKARESDIEGTGLGLAICRQIIQAHGGKIWAESKQGQGSTFFFTLPIM